MSKILKHEQANMQGRFKYEALGMENTSQQPTGTWLHFTSDILHSITTHNTVSLWL